MIDHDLKVRSCNECYKVKPFSHFSPVSKKNRSPAHRCKPCRSIAASNREMEKRLEKQPELYYQCESCDKIFKRSRKANGNSEVVSLSSCLFCKENIND